MVARDRPGCLWLFGLWFVAGGVLATLMPFVAVNRSEVPWWGRLLAVVIGLTTLAGGLFTIRAHPETTAELDRGSGFGRVRTRGFARATTTATFPLADVRALEVTTERDSDGDPLYRTRLWLADSRALWLQANAVYGAESVQAQAARIRGFLGLAEPVP